jgi:hypothetical protein
MSLSTDIIFVKALKSNQELLDLLPAKDIYNTSILLPDRELINAPIPYILVAFDGLENDGQTKDSFEGDSDAVTISVEMSAKNREQLADIAEMVRTTIREYFENADPESDDYALIPEDYQLSASPVVFDQDKPSFWQTLTYRCDTNI